ncbi:putative cytosolic carboxypeptidase 1 isoform X1 [Sesbania bispinosa]|nr:putative cytosolic carboxypeptidase 1 isoform X1 [Sesbania bispinosa]
MELGFNAWDLIYKEPPHLNLSFPGMTPSASVSRSRSFHHEPDSCSPLMTFVFAASGAA